MDESNSYILTVSCPDTVGIVAEVAGYLRDLQFFIEESSHYGDLETSRFFMRTRFVPQSGHYDADEYSAGFQDIAERFDMEWAIYDTSILPRVLIMASKFDHCLNDLLYRYRAGGLRIAIPAIVSNHTDLAELADWHSIPYFHIPVTRKTREKAEQRLLEIIIDTHTELVVLARYMQILSDHFCTKLAGRVINIHHSFLPSFKGANPYQQAHERGVKLIGATAHYVTPDLDEGPIIEQTVERVDHSHSTEDMVAIGRDVEAITLARAVQFHTEHRVFLNGKRTVVFRR
jgi:formyltetrahydrofolate deformylase